MAQRPPESGTPGTTDQTRPNEVVEPSVDVVETPESASAAGDSVDHDKQDDAPRATGRTVPGDQVAGSPDVTPEPAGEPVEEPAGEPVEEPAGEPVEEPAGEPVGEPLDEPAAAPAEAVLSVESLGSVTPAAKPAAAAVPTAPEADAPTREQPEHPSGRPPGRPAAPPEDDAEVAVDAPTVATPVDRPSGSPVDRQTERPTERPVPPEDAAEAPTVIAPAGRPLQVSPPADPPRPTPPAPADDTAADTPTVVAPVGAGYPPPDAAYPPPAASAYPPPPTTPSGSGSSSEPPRGRRYGWWAAGGGLVLVAAYAAAAVVTSGSAPKGTTVAGVPVGGKDRAGIVAALEQASERAGTRLPVSGGGRTAELDLAVAGITVDPTRTAESLTGLTFSPVALWEHVNGGGAHEATGGDGAGLADQLAAVGKTLDTEPEDAAVSFSTKDDEVAVTVEDGKAGIRLVTDRAEDVVREAWLGSRRPLPLPVETADADVTSEEARRAADEIAGPAVAAPVQLTVGDVEVAVGPKLLASSLSMKPDEDGALALSLDGTKLRDDIMEEDGTKLGKEPKDATVELKNGRPRVVPGVSGVTMDPKALNAAVLPALAAGGDRKAKVETAVRQPEFTTEDAEKLGVKERTSTFSTILTDNQLRTENLRVAAREVDGTLVKPGETFSLNTVLGRRTAEKGYNQAPAISGGRLVNDYGGGVSQMATTIFNNVFFTGLEDIYHKPHSFYISRYPEGREATVNYPTVDLKWRNDSPYGVLIQANVTSKVNVSFWSTKVWDVEATKGPRTNPRGTTTIYDDSPGCVVQGANPGFDVSVTRIFKKDGNVVRRQTFHTTYIAEDRVVCGPKPKSAGDAGN